MAKSLKNILSTSLLQKHIMEEQAIKNADPVTIPKGLVVQHNSLINAHYRLSLQEKRLILWLISRVQPHDEDFKKHTLKIAEFAEMLGISSNSIYERFKTIATSLMKRIVTIKPLNDSNTTILVAWLGAAVYKKHGKGDGTITLSFFPELKPFLLQLKSHFTAIKMPDILQLKSIYAVRIYELLKQYENLKERRLTVEELRNCCGIDDNKLERITDFKRKVLTIAQREINEKTDIFIEYEFIKTSRKFTDIRFSIKQNPHYRETKFEQSQLQKSHSIQKEMRSLNAILEEIIEYGFSRKAVQNLIKNYTEEVLSNAVRAVNIQVERGHVKNPKAMLQTAIKDKWHPEKYVDRKKKRD